MVAAEEGLSRELDHCEREMTTDQVDGEIASLQEALDATIRERDTKVVLAHLLRRADREFREKNDPDIIERAGSHLSAITDGRYVELIAPEVDPTASLMVTDPDTRQEVPVGSLSKGTQEQVYFSLRLAIMDHLDGEGERLPVLVDEAFVNWDPERRGRALGVLGRLAETRQVFVFTCHPEWAAELCERGGTLISLEP